MEAPPQIQAPGEQSVNSALPRIEDLSEASQTASEYVITSLVAIEWLRITLFGITNFDFQIY